MSTAGNFWRVGWRLLVCALLLLWITHAIFLNEGRLAFQGTGVEWSELPRTVRWEIAWLHGPRALWRTLVSVPASALIGSVAVMGAIIGLGVHRWRIALETQGLHLPFARALKISLVAHFFNSFFLGVTGGDLMKAYYAARETAHRKTEAVVTVFIDRVIGLWAMLLFACVMAGFNLSLIGEHPRVRILLAVIGVMFVAGTGFVTLAFWGGLSRGWGGARNWLRKLPRGEWLDRSLESCRTFGRHRRFFLRMLVVSMILNVLCVLQYVVLAEGMEMNVSPKVWALLVPSIICISALPVTPSGLGVRENIYVVILAAAPFYVAETSALAISLLSFAGSLVWSLIGGVVYLALPERRRLAAAATDDVESA